MESSVESLCNALAKSRLFSTEEVRSLLQRWRQEAGPAVHDGEAFSRWLVDRRHVTEWQVGLLARGHAEQLRLDQYTLLERIGRGRMAGVYKAVHRLGQTVAIKILPPSKAQDPQVLGRFRREAQLAVRLQHPNIVRTFQTGETNGLHYLVMECLEGETLEEVLQRRKQLPPAEAVRLVHQALAGLQHMNEKDLVHRDLKPANLMLVGGTPETAATATVKILDIGAGRALFDEGPEGVPGQELTNEGDLLGATDYLAPEQARDARKADIRADIYSLGCVLYHALAGQPPFADSNRVRQLVRHATEPPRPVREFNPAVPGGLEQILEWMLAKDPAQRYPTPERAAQALQVFLSGAAAEEKAPPQMSAYLQWLEKEGATAPGPAPQPATVDITPDIPGPRPVAGGTALPGWLPGALPRPPGPSTPPKSPRSSRPASQPSPARAADKTMLPAVRPPVLQPPRPPREPEVIEVEPIDVGTGPPSVNVELVPLSPTGTGKKGAETILGMKPIVFFLVLVGLGLCVGLLAIVTVILILKRSG